MGFLPLPPPRLDPNPIRDRENLIHWEQANRRLQHVRTILVVSAVWFFICIGFMMYNIQKRKQTQQQPVQAEKVEQR